MGRPRLPCRHCGAEKTRANTTRAKTQGRIDWECVPCRQIATARWQRENKDKVAEATLSRLYGISRDEAKRLRSIDSCEVCGGAGRMVVDHNHRTGEVRGVLCNGCNTALGQAGDNPDRLRALANYLDRNGSYGSVQD